jgi:hypothetical protein
MIDGDEAGGYNERRSDSVYRYELPLKASFSCTDSYLVGKLYISRHTAAFFVPSSYCLTLYIAWDLRDYHFYN